jgi:hypothetical protein
MAPSATTSEFDQSVIAPSTAVKVRLEPEVPAVTTTSAVPFSKIELVPETVIFAPAVTVPPKTATDPDEEIGVESVTFAAFCVAPEITPPVPDCPIVTDPMLPEFVPAIPVNVQGLPNVCAELNDCEEGLIVAGPLVLTFTAVAAEIVSPTTSIAPVDEPPLRAPRLIVPVQAIPRVPPFKVTSP